MRGLLTTYLFLTIFWSQPMYGQSIDFSKGKWAKIATVQQGVHTLTGKQLKQLGFSLPMGSQRLQIWGMDATLLSYKVPDTIPLNQELAIQIKDGGDGIFDEGDTCLFYSQGPQLWRYEITGQQWTSIPTTTQDSLFFFVTMGEAGKRIHVRQLEDPNAPVVDQYISHQHIEQDSINLLNSGQQWLGAPMGTGLGKTSQLNYPVTATNIVTGAPIQIKGRYVAASFGIDALFEVGINGTKMHSIALPSVSGLLYDATANAVADSFNYVPSNWHPTTNQINVKFTGSANGTGWLDFIDLHVPVYASFNTSNAFFFNSVAPPQHGLNANFQIQSADASTQVWDVENRMEPVLCKGNFQNNIYRFCAPQNATNAFWVTKQANYINAIIIDTIATQNIQSVGPVDYVIISPPTFKEAAIRLQSFHQNLNRFKVVIVDPSHIYNEFSGGQISPIAIRNYLQYIKQKAQVGGYDAPKYLLIFGGANFALKKLNKQIEVPVYESVSSNEILSTYSSDDFYGILHPGEDIALPNTINELSLAIGRIPSKTKMESDTAVHKIIQYQQGGNRGVWQNQLTWIADDEDYNLHLQDAEEIVQHLQTKQADWDHKKIYLDMYPSVVNSGGITYPAANMAIRQTINSGALLLNYTGHGNYLRLSEQAVISAAEIQNWENAGRLPLLVTASCDFAPYDQPQLNPIGFAALMQNSKGIVGLVAANRLVFAYSNKQMNDHFIQSLLVPDQNGSYLSVGKALQKAKQLSWQQNGDRLNAFKFNFMGDPALQLLSVHNKVHFTNLNQKIFEGRDTILSGRPSMIEGKIYRGQQWDSSFNGKIDIVIWDTKKTKNTLGNTATSIKTSIVTQESILFKGTSLVQNGAFASAFILPKELNAIKEPIKIEAFAYNDTGDALGIADSVFVKASQIETHQDTVGPVLRAYINDTNFVKGSWITNPATLLLFVKDSSGIQSAGTALGHDIEVILDDAIQNPIVLNNYYTADLNTYQSGKILYSLPIFSEGPHHISIKVWDMLGNLTKDSVHFVVPTTDHLLAHGLTHYPNPVVQDATISFDVNQIKTDYKISFELISLNGTILLTQTMNPYLIANKVVMHWDGLDQTGARLIPGVYYYRIIVENGVEKQILTNKLIKF